MKKTFRYVRLTALFAFLSLIAADASAQARTIWLSSDESPLREEVEGQLREFLSGSSDSHVVGTDDLAQELEGLNGRVPACLDGRGECTSLRTATAEAFGIRQIVAVKVLTRAEAQAEVQCTVRSPDGSYERTITAEAGAVRAALLQCVGAITEGRGRLTISTNPPGARVRIDNHAAGTSPVEQRMDVGVHLIHVELAGYHSVQEAVEVRPNDTTSRTIELERSMAIMVVRSATPGAVVDLDGGSQIYPVGEEVLIEPGAHTVTVTAPGYASIERQIEFEEGERVELRAALSLSNDEITRREVQRIKDRPLMLQAGVHFSRFNTDWNDALVSGTTPDSSIICAIRPTTSACDRPGVTALGIQAELIYAWKALEIEPIGFGYRILAMSDKGTDYRLDNANLRLSHQRAHRWMFRIAHIGARFLIDEYWEPYARAGFTINLDRGQAEDLLGDTGEYKFRRTGLELEIRAGTRFHVNSLLYGYAELLFGAEIKNAGTRPTWGISGGVGVNLPSPFANGTRQQASAESELEESP